jgi:hypothetical protein
LQIQMVEGMGAYSVEKKQTAAEISMAMNLAI